MSEKMLLEHIDEKTFEKSNVEYDTELVRVADQVNTMVERGGINLMTVTPVFPEPSGKQLRFTINKGKNRVDREISKHLYRVTIEKIEQRPQDKEYYDKNRNNWVYEDTDINKS